MLSGFPILAWKNQVSYPQHLICPALELLWAPQEEERILHFLKKKQIQEIVFACWVLCCWVVGSPPTSEWTTIFYRMQSCRNSYYGGGQLAAQELSQCIIQSLDCQIVISPSKPGILFYMCCRRGKEGYTHIRAGKFYLINCSITEWEWRQYWTQSSWPGLL